MKKKSLAIDRLNLIKEWHQTKNGYLTPYDFSYASNKKVWWICSSGHEWKASINSRNHLNRGCPYCFHNKVLFGKTDLESLYPDIAKEWNYKKNSPLVPENVSPHSNLKVWWICPKGHEWNSRVGNRTSKNNGCPYCAKLKLPKYAKSCLKTDRPDVCRYWDYELNNELKPDMVGVNSAISIWLKCNNCGYSWSERVRNITK